MPKEIEIRFQVSSDFIESYPRLAVLFRSAKTYKEEDHYFLSGMRIRLKYDKSGNWYTLEHTHKGQDETPERPVRVREEPTVRIHPASRSLLQEECAFRETLADEEFFVCQKRVRELNYFTCRGNLVKVFWVTMPQIGDFLEIEGSSSRIVLAVARSFGLNPEEAIKLNWRELYSEHCRTHKILFEPRDLLFEEVVHA